MPAGHCHLHPARGRPPHTDHQRTSPPRHRRHPAKANPDATESATWSAVRDPNTAYPYGIAVFDVDPGTLPGGRTTITVSLGANARA